jgi:hypothetical protein
MQALENVVELNEAAAIGLHEGRLDDSILLLRQALNLYRQELTEETKGVDDGDPADVSDRVIGIILHTSLCQGDQSISPDNVFAPFNGAFCFEEGGASVDSAAVVVLYNYGLALHRRGMVRGCETDLRRALQLYGMAFGLLQDEAMTTRYEMGRVGLALLANQAHLYQHFLQHERVTYCMNGIQSMLAKRQLMSLNDEELFFFFHVVFFSSRKMAASPAA